MDREIKVVMLPWLAFGHMTPFLQLAKALARSGIHVSFLSTPRNVQRLPKPPPSLASLISLVELPFPQLDEKHFLPEGAEATIDITFDKMDSLKVAYDLLRRPFERFVVDHKPDWIFLDFNTDWAVDIAKEHGVRLVWFQVFCTAVNVFLGPVEYLAGEGRRRIRPSPESLMSPPEWVTFMSSVACRSFDAVASHTILYEENATGKKDADRMAKILDSCQAVALRTCPEIEGEYLELYEKIIKKPAIPVGLLLPEPPQEKEVAEGSWGKVFKWLDEQKPKSVVFVGFGSECKLTKDQVFEIAHGLELSELPFLWALRKPSWAADHLDALPSGFGHRTSSKGMVCFGWVPQVEILAHPSIGGSLFHGGWGSAIETLLHGHSLIVLPFIVDQGLNARLLVDKGLAVEVERKEDGSYSKDGVAKSLRIAMVLEEGEELRIQTRDVAKTFGNRKLHEGYMARFVKFLKNNSTKQK